MVRQSGDRQFIDCGTKREYALTLARQQGGFEVASPAQKEYLNTLSWS